jgi:FMN reductase
VEPLRVTGLGGSMRAGSTSLLAVKVALEGAEASGASTELLDLRALDLPIYRPELEGDGVPENARSMCQAMYSAAGLIWSSPLYQGTVSGAFKNAIDWLQLLADRDPAFLTDKVIGLVSTAGGIQGLQSINTMEYSVRALRGWAVPLVVPVPQSWQAFDEQGRPRDKGIEAQLVTLGKEVARVAERMTLKQLPDPASECARAAANAMAAQEGA